MECFQIQVRKANMMELDNMLSQDLVKLVIHSKMDRILTLGSKSIINIVILLVGKIMASMAVKTGAKMHHIGQKMNNINIIKTMLAKNTTHINNQEMAKTKAIEIQIVRRKLKHFLKSFKRSNKIIMNELCKMNRIGEVDSGIDNKMKIKVIKTLVRVIRLILYREECLLLDLVMHFYD